MELSNPNLNKTADFIIDLSIAWQSMRSLVLEKKETSHCTLIFRNKKHLQKNEGGDHLGEFAYPV